MCKPSTLSRQICKELRLTVAMLFVGALLSVSSPVPIDAQASTEDVVLHDCMLVFRYGSDPSTGLILRGSEARDLNNNGQIVGWASTESGAIHATLWSGETKTDLGTLGGVNSCALGINDSGQIVGWAETEDGDHHAVRWDEGQAVDLGVVPGEDSVAYAINDKGRAVGLSWPDVVTLPRPIGRAILWEDDQLIDLCAQMDVAGSGAYDIDELDRVVGWVVTNSGIVQAVRWSAGDLTIIGIDSAARSIALATNTAGQVVGWSESPSNNNDRHAMFWFNESSVDLTAPVLDESIIVWSVARDINSDGLITGSIETSDGYLSAVIWSLESRVTTLQNPGSSKSEGYAINDHGQVIGWRVVECGEPRAFLWSDGAMIALPGEAD